jgi:peptidyl-prolyl cis-trans isomerase B (cyclophilin B)
MEGPASAGRDGVAPRRSRTPAPRRSGWHALVVAVALAAAAVGGSAHNGMTPATAGVPSRASTPGPLTLNSKKSPSCSFRSTRQDTGGRHPGLPSQPAPGPTKVRLRTSVGTFLLRLDVAKAPCTTSSFRHLVETRFYDGTDCTRLTTISIFLLECGNPSRSGSGGPGYTIPDENLSEATYRTGTVAMANTGKPHSGGSQFFIVYQTSPLPPQYTPFATVLSGLGVILKVAAAGTDDANGSGDGSPLLHVTIKSATMVLIVDKR